MRPVHYGMTSLINWIVPSTKDFGRGDASSSSLCRQRFLSDLVKQGSQYPSSTSSSIQCHIRYPYNSHIIVGIPSCSQAFWSAVAVDGEITLSSSEFWYEARSEVCICRLAHLPGKDRCLLRRTLFTFFGLLVRWVLHYLGVSSRKPSQTPLVRCIYRIVRGARIAIWASAFH